MSSSADLAGQHSGAAYPPDDGFTLLETLVALTILSLSVSVLFAIFATSIQRAREDGAEMGARVLAQGLLAAAQAHSSFDGSAGDSGKYRWRVQVDPEEPATNAAPHLARVTAIVHWKSAGYDKSMSLGAEVFKAAERSR